MNKGLSAMLQKRSAWDYLLLLAVGGLLAIGLLMVYSSSFALAYEAYGTPNYFFLRQVGWVLLGLLGMLVATRIRYHRWRDFSIPLFGLTLVLLIAVLLFGVEENGARRWLWGTSVQPSELAKLTVVLYLAHWLSSKGDRIRYLTYGLVPFSVLIGFLAGLIVLEPDLGTTLLILGIAAVLFFVAGADLRQLGMSFLMGGLTFLLLISQLDYARQRVETYFSDPIHDPFSPQNYHVAQTLVALGSGGIWGAGLGQSQQKLGFLPAPHTDAIFAVLGEEMGLWGTWLVVALFALFAYRGMRIALQAPDAYGLLLAGGVTVWLTLQALINMGVSTASLPFTGLPLPFVSFGGSSLVVSLTGVGILLNVAKSQAAEMQRSRPQWRVLAGGKEGWNETLDLRWWHGGSRLSGPRRP